MEPATAPPADRIAALHATAECTERRLVGASGAVAAPRMPVSSATFTRISEAAAVAAVEAFYGSLERPTR